MRNSEEEALSQGTVDYINWEYAPPPTPYDVVRDSIPLKMARLLTHSTTRLGLRCYNRLRTSGRENLLNNLPCIITPNHSSHLDAPVVFAALPILYVNNTYTLAAKDYFFNNAAVTLGARLMANVIPIDRTGSENRGLLLCLSKQREGKSILLFPEGTRAQNDEMGNFHKGAIVLSRKARMAIIPTFIYGAGKSLPKSRIFPKPWKISVIFGKPVRYWEGSLAELTEDEATKELENRVHNLREVVKNVELRA